MISRINAVEFDTRDLENAIPVIIVDALESWHIAERWSPTDLAAIAGAREVTVAVAKDGRYLYNESADATRRFEYDQKDIPFAEAVRTIVDNELGNRFYVLAQPIAEKLPELLQILVVPPWIRAHNPDMNLWLGRDTCGPLHYDYLNNFFAQLHGTKRFVICSPADTTHLYPYRCDAFMSHCSHVDVNQPDPVSHPAFALASPVTFELQAGELLFLPAFWWHQVQGVGVSVSVNHWWPPCAAQFFDSPNSVRDLPRLYGSDRLLNFKRTCLLPAGEDFLSAAEVLMKQGRTWGATLLGLAAFDELLSGWYPRARPRGCALSELADELRRAWTEVAPAISRSQQQKQALDQVPELAAIASYCEDARLEPRVVMSLLETLKLLRTTAAVAA